MKLAMKIGGEYLARRVAARHWRRQAEAGGLPADDVVARVRTLATEVTDALAGVCAADEIRALQSPLPARLLDRVAAHAARCLSMLEES
jgi:hypothetical protein